MPARRPVQIDGQDFAAGVFLVDKPKDASSFAMVRKIRWLLGVKKVGHAGTLDPFATGLLIICAGRPATRHIDDFMQGKKEYRALLQLGIETLTQDPEGEVTGVKDVPLLNENDLQGMLLPFVGQQMQAPPPFSAAKYKGKPLYHYARQGVMIEKDPKPIEIYALEYMGYDAQTAQLDIKVCCSRGTYIRVLAADIGKRLGCGAHLTALRRTVSGDFSVDRAVPGDRLFEEDGLQHLLANMMSIEQALDQSR